MKLLYTLFALTCISSSAMAQTAVANLDINDVQAGIRSNGLIGGSAPFLVPAADNTSPLYSAGLWLGGITNDNQLRLAAHMYGAAGHDFYPGPLTTDGSASISAETVAIYDQLWLVNAADVSLHVAYVNCLSDVDCDPATEFPNGYTIPPAFLNWPAMGDVLGGQAPYLAPFIDYDANGFYDPTAGDHPCMPGDQAMFMIFNDKGGPHTESGGDPIGVEVQMTAFAYASQPHLDQTVFVHYKIINRSAETYSDFRITCFADMDIGCPDDDFIGTDVQRNMVYAYNWDDIDMDCFGIPGYGEQPPAFGVMVLKGPLMDPNGMDDPNNDLLPAYTGSGFGDGVVDNERHGLSNSMFFKREGPSEMTPPTNAAQFYGYMDNQWKNGVPLAYGGIGYNDGPDAIHARFAYPGTTDPVGAGASGEPQPAWQEEVPGLSVDPKVLATMGPITMLPGEEQDILIAYVYARATEGGSSAGVEALKQRADSVRAFAETIPGIMAPGGLCDHLVLGLTTHSRPDRPLEVFPNPSQTHINVALDQESIGGMLRVMDMRGAVILERRITSTSTVLEIGSLSPGTYVIRCDSDRVMQVGRFVKE